MKKLVFLLTLSLLLVGCSRFSSNTEQQYLQSKNGANLVVPPPLTAENLSHFYDLPAQTENARVNIAPPIDTMQSDTTT